MEAFCKYACIDKGEVICQLPSRGERVGRRTQLALARVAEHALGLATAAGGGSPPADGYGLVDIAQQEYDELDDRVQKCITFHRQTPATESTAE